MSTFLKKNLIISIFAALGTGLCVAFVMIYLFNRSISILNIPEPVDSVRIIFLPLVEDFAGMGECYIMPSGAYLPVNSLNNKNPIYRLPYTIKNDINQSTSGINAVFICKNGFWGKYWQFIGIKDKNVSS